MKKLYNEKDVLNLANAIRNKASFSDKMKLSEMSTKIDSIDLDECYQKVIDGTIEDISFINDIANLTELPPCIFQNSKVKGINLNNVSVVGQQCFKNCTNITQNSVIDIKKLEKIGNSAFYNCFTYCGHMTLRKADGIIQCSSPYAFGGKNVVAPSYFYVPRDLIDAYKTDAIYSILLGYPKGYQLRALEDYTVDGTITGDIDLTKI